LIQDFDQEDSHGIVNEVLDSAVEKKNEVTDKSWTFTRSDGTVIIIREIFDKIVNSIVKFQEAADFLVSLDASGHAALPWAIVKFFLSVE
jgi:hypothetical protein